MGSPLLDYTWSTGAKSATTVQPTALLIDVLRSRLRPGVDGIKQAPVLHGCMLLSPRPAGLALMSPSLPHLQQGPLPQEDQGFSLIPVPTQTPPTTPLTGCRPEGGAQPLCLQGGGGRDLRPGNGGAGRRCHGAVLGAGSLQARVETTSQGQRWGRDLGLRPLQSSTRWWCQACPFVLWPCPLRAPPHLPALLDLSTVKNKLQNCLLWFHPSLFQAAPRCPRLTTQRHWYFYVPPHTIVVLPHSLPVQPEPVKPCQWV